MRINLRPYFYRLSLADRWRLVDIAAMAALAALLLTGCVTGPDGRRVLSPAAAAILGDVLDCGSRFAASAVGGQPDYGAAALCHVDRLRARIGAGQGRAVEIDPEHGALVVEAAKAEDAGDHARARKLAGQCDAIAREKIEASQ